MYDPANTRALFSAVLVQAIKDLDGPPTDRQGRHDEMSQKAVYKRQAQAFFEGKGEWFRWVCEAVGLDPAKVHNAYMSGRLSEVSHALKLHTQHAGKGPDGVSS